ncbi:MAG: prepilin-type N-terminal cleavage/methylation domain-containing protein [Sulfuricella sp.]|nr:prepilin-type N-terminal cleavage/methylation domain-containing protein [Sulfuricella sp.]
MNARLRGFTLVELLVVLAIIATLMSLVTPRYTGSVDKAKEAVLREDLASLREAIDKHYGDTGKYPASLDDLVSKRYIRRVPVDPITDSAATWILLPPPDPQKGAVFDVKSGAPGKSRDGTPYSGW